MAFENQVYCPIGHKYYYAPNFETSAFAVVRGADFSNISVVSLSGAGLSAGVSGISGASDNYIRKNYYFPSGDITIFASYSVKDSGNVDSPLDDRLYQYGGISFVNSLNQHTGISFCRINTAGSYPRFAIHAGLFTNFYVSDPLLQSTYYDVEVTFRRVSGVWTSRFVVASEGIDFTLSATPPSYNSIIVSAPLSTGSGSNLILRELYIAGKDSGLPGTCVGTAGTFSVSKLTGVSPFYIRLTDTSDFSQITTSTNYRRSWAVTNNMTSATEYVNSTSASINKIINGALGDTFTVSMSASLPRIFETSFENVTDFNGWYIVTPGEYGTWQELSTEQVVSGTYSHKAYILSANASDNLFTSAYLPHRGYPTILFEYHDSVPSVYETVSGSAYDTPCLASLYVWVDITLTRRASLDDWFSFATFDSNTSWIDVVTVNLTPDNYIYCFHVPYRNMSDHVYIGTSANGGVVFPQRQWVRLDFFLNFDPVNGYIKVWQDGVLVNHALVKGRQPRLSLAHFGMYASPAVTSGTCFNENLRIMEVADELEALELIGQPLTINL